MLPALRLTRLLGARVGLPDGRHGRLEDLAADLSAPSPVVTGLGLRFARRRAWVRWSDVVLQDGPSGGRLTALAVDDRASVPPLLTAEILLRRDLLDTLVLDRASGRRTRVGEVWLARESGGELQVLGVETGGTPVRRRLGLTLPPVERPPRLLTMRQLHLTSPRGHQAQLALRLVDDTPDEELAHLVTHLPTGHAGDLLRRLPDLRAIGVRQRVHPSVRERLDHARRPAGVPGRRRLRRTAGWRSYRPDSKPGP